jgi:hypothetical protein
MTMFWRCSCGSHSQIEHMRGKWRLFSKSTLLLRNFLEIPTHVNRKPELADSRF